MSAANEFLFRSAFPFMGDKFMQYFLSLGAWELTAGDAQEGYLGSRFQSVLGMDWEVVFSPFGWLLGPGRRNPFTDLIMGLGDEVNFVYGSRINVVYGGPYADVSRGSRIRKIGKARPTIETSKVPPTPLALLEEESEAEAKERWLRSNVAASIEQGDNTIFAGVVILSVLLQLSTTILEIVAHATFGEYDKEHGHATIGREQGDPTAPLKPGDVVTIQPAPLDAHSDIASLFLGMREVHRWLPRRIMALIYHFEIVGTWDAYKKNLEDGFIRFAKKLGWVLGFALVPPYATYRAFGKNRVLHGKKKIAYYAGLLVGIIYMVVLILLMIPGVM
jgi:hypothetical protein